MLEQRYSDNDASKRDIPSFIEPRPPLILNPYMRPRPQKGTNLLERFEEDSEYEEPELVQVYLRMKPCSVPTNLYEVRSDKCLITSLDTTTAGHGRRTQHNVSKMYTFSHIFDSEASQKEIFEHVVKDNLRKLPEGHSFTLLTYGASGSGKTYTLMGTVASPGLVPRSLEYVFKVVDAAQQPLYKPAEGGADKLSYTQQDYELQWVKRLRHISAPLRDKYRRMSVQLCNDLTASNLDLSNRTRYYVWVSFVEIYNEGIYDLLVPGERRTSSKLQIREDTNGNVYLKGATQAFVRTGEEAYDVMVAGKHNLQVAATGVHAQSSRSHCIFTITMLTETEDGCRASCVRLCDLAGCERARRTRNTGARMQESRAINSSLHVLERCLHTLRRRQRAVPAPPRPLVPYRESKLTRLLGAGLSGTRGEAVSMVVTLNPSPDYAYETRHVLQLAAVARDIQVNNTISEYPSTLESSTQDTTIGFSTEVMKLRSDNERLHFELVQAQARNKELAASMEEHQAAAADTMREIVEEAKEITKQYYEAQLQALREEMEEMVEEYESRLSKIEAPLPDTGTPAKVLRNKIAQLMTDVAILEEKLTAERLARARAEEEVQHLRACIEERDEKAFEEATEEVMSLTDSDHDSDVDEDPANESLEPTFKKEDINRSRLLRQSAIRQHDTSSEQSIDNNDSVLEKSSDTIKDTKTNDSTDCTYATGEDDSTELKKVNDTKYEQSHNSNDSHAVNADQINIKTEAYTKKGPYFPDIDIDVNKNVSKTNFARGTYFVSDSKVSIKSLNDVHIKDDHNIEKIQTSKNDTGTTETKDDSGVIDSESTDKFDEFNIPRKASETLVNKIIKSLRPTSNANNSLAQFEQLEIATKTVDNDVKRNVSEEFTQIKMLKEKRTYFDDDKQEPSALITVNKNKQKKIYFDNIDIDNTSLLKTTQVKITDYVRSPSIVTEEETQSEPSTMKILLGESLTRQVDPIPSVFKQAIRKTKHDSVDIFESPNVIKDNKLDIEEVRKSIKNIELSKKDTKLITNSEEESYVENVAVKMKSEDQKEIIPEASLKNIKLETLQCASIVAEELAKGLSKKDMTRTQTAKENDITTEPAKDSSKQEIIRPQAAKEKVSTTEPIKDLPKQEMTVPQTVIGKYNTTKPTKDLSKQEITLPQTAMRKDNTTEPIKDISKLEMTQPQMDKGEDNTIEEFENMYKDITPRATEFELLLSQDSQESNEVEKPSKDNQEATETELTKYQLRKRAQKDKMKPREEKRADEEILIESSAKCESRTQINKRSLRLRRRKNQSEENEQEKGDKLKDIVNLQSEFSDVTLDVPAPNKVVKDIPSPQKNVGEEENLPPVMGIQSCPSKSVTRSRRKLFTPRAEPLEESPSQAGDSNERIYVPRPSYHRPRARRKL